MAICLERQQKIPISPLSLFRIASISKPFRAAAVFNGMWAIEQTRYKRAPQPLEVQINTGGSRIEGIARIEGQPARPGMLVVLAPPPTRRQNRALYKVAFTDSDGRFVFRGVPPDEFKLFAWNVTPIGAYKNDAFLARFESSGQTVRVPQDTTVTVPVSIVESYFAR